MQPSKTSIEIGILKRAWDMFTNTGKLPDEIELDPLVSASWMRCGTRMNPNSQLNWVYESEGPFQSTLKQLVALRNIARPIIEDIYQYIEGSSAVLLLTDSTGCLIDMLGDPETTASLQSKGLRPGAYLDEGHLGTNAVGVTLFEAMPSQVIGPEHFSARLHALSTVAAAINKLDGHPIGILGMVEPIERRSDQSFGVVIAGARAIENQLRADLVIREANTRTAELYATMDSITEGVLAWTSQGIILHLNEQAGKILHLSFRTVVGRPLAEFISFPENLAHAVALGQELNDVETALFVDGVPHQCLVSLRIIGSQENDTRVCIVTIRHIEQVHQLVNRLVGAQARLTLDDIVGHGPGARKIRKQALTAANATGCALLLGESGTGKNVLARAIHNSGRRAGGPFLAMNCRAIPRELALGEFLGYEAGAFNSGPSTGQPSKFELAHGGTLLLEEIESLPLEMQAALQQVIEMKDVIRLGGKRVIPVDVRIIGSTTRTMDELVEQDSFRHDLLLRLSSFLIAMEPLRDHPEDIPLLVERLLEKLTIQFSQSLKISPDALAALCKYPWPGNVRELETIMERAAVQCDGGQISLENLPSVINHRSALVKGKTLAQPAQSLVEAEKAAILAAGRAARGSLSQAAQLLEIGRTTLWRKMKEFGISVDDFQ